MKRAASDIYSTPPSNLPTPLRAVAGSSLPATARTSGSVPRRKNYAMGAVDRFSADFSTASLTADQAVFASLHSARARARILENNEAHVRKFLVMAKTSIVGDKGIRLRSNAGDYNKGKFIPNRFDQNLIERAYVDFSKAWNFSTDHRLNRRRFAQVGIQRVFVDGEFIAQKIKGADNPYGYALNMIDAERLDHRLNRKAKPGTNEIRMGVELDSNSRPVNYYFLKAAPVQFHGIATIGAQHEIIPADQILHIFIQERPGQTRGITWLAPTGLRTKMLDGITTAVTVGYRVAASKMGFFTRGEEYEAQVDQDGKPVADFSDVPQDCAPGEFWELPEGLNFESFDPSYPGTDYDGFKKSIEREIAGGLGVSYPELANDFSGVSYSAGQIGVHSDVAFWQDLQQFWVDAFEEPVYRDWLLMAITAGALKLPVSRLYKFQEVKFQPPRRKHIDPKKTHEAQNLALSATTRDPFEVAAENGSDLEDVIENTARAIELLKENGLPIPAVWGSALVMPASPDLPDD